MQILFIGDIVGKPARKATKIILEKLKEEYQVDLIITNGENLAHGKGMSEKTMNEMIEAGIDFFTSGNHIWSNRSFLPLLDEKKTPAIRPANYPPEVPGRGFEVIKTKKKEDLLLINLQGRVFLHPDLDCPFRILEKILNDHKKIKNVIVDFHAEATSEKYALLRNFDGRISAILGTHTHIQTNDAHITGQGTAFVCDTGSVRAQNSVLGVQSDIIVEKFLTQMPIHHEIAEEGPIIFNAVRLLLDAKKGQATEIELINKTVDL